VENGLQWPRPELPVKAVDREICDLNDLIIFVDEASDNAESAALGINVAMIYVVEKLDAKLAKFFLKSRFA